MLPDSLPKSVDDLAHRIVADATATTPYAQAAALRDFFWANFTYDIGVDLGDDTNAISSFLNTRRGFCVQFASTYAVMARALGIPARVAVGFTPGKTAGGVFHVQSHDAHAWPEIWLAGLGWTHLFDPTPPANGTTAGGSDLATNAAPVQPPSGASATTLAPPATTSPPNGGDTSGASAPTTLAPIPPRVSTTEPAHGSNPWFVVIALLATIVASIALYAVVVITAKSRRRARRRGAEPAAAVRGAWEEALDSLHVARVPRDPALTPIELARSAPRHGITAATRPLRSLASTYTIARYGTTAPSTDDVDRAWASVDELDRALDTGVTRWQRLRRRLDPSPLRTRSGRR